MFFPTQGELNPQLLYAIVFTVPMLVHHVARIPMLKSGWTSHWAAQGAIASAAGASALLLYTYPATFIYFNF
jgi:hypothetical protein